MKFSFMQNPLTQIPFFAWIYNSFINSHLLEWLKVRQIKSGIRVNFDQCDHDLISRQSMTAFKMHFWRRSVIKWCTLLYILRMTSDHVVGCSWYHAWLIWMKFSENVGMIPIKIWNFLQFLFKWTNKPQIHIQIVWKLCSHPVGKIFNWYGENL